MQSVDLSAIPNFCSHEHWGSITAIGSLPEGFRADAECGATPAGRTGLLDILLDPYFRGNLYAAGDGPEKVARPEGVKDFDAWAHQDPAAAFASLRPAIARQGFTGTYQCIRGGLQFLYDTDIMEDPVAVAAVDRAIGENYSTLHAWYQTVMKRARFSVLIRPVHPEYYFREQSPATAREERSFTHTVLRIDPLLGLWTSSSPRRDHLAELTGIAPKDAESWRAFLAKLFELAEGRGARGIKQLQAYTRALDFPACRDADVVWSGGLTPNEIRTFQDWVVNECCRLADARGWPHQVHVGTHNLAQSSPLPLASLATRYPHMKLVMLHCWPFLDECGWLAKHHPNVYIDTCWQPVLNPAFYEEAMTSWLTYVPMHKIMCAHDSTSVEMAVGSSLFTREILAQVLTQHLSLSSSHRLEQAAAGFLHNNAVAVYGIGTPV
jgi:hypothetical protein